MAHGLSCSAACGIFPDQGLNPCPLHWQADSFLTTAPPGKSPPRHILICSNQNSVKTHILHVDVMCLKFLLMWVSPSFTFVFHELKRLGQFPCKMSHLLDSCCFLPMSLIPSTPVFSIKWELHIKGVMR